MGGGFLVISDSGTLVKKLSEVTQYFPLSYCLAIADSISFVCFFFNFPAELDIVLHLSLLINLIWGKITLITIEVGAEKQIEKKARQERELAKQSNSNNETLPTRYSV